MFLDSLIESGPSRQRRRSWPTLVSFAFEMAIVAAMVVAPLWYTGALPPSHSERIVAVLPPVGPPPGPSNQEHPLPSNPEEATDLRIHAPGHIPTHIPTGPDPAGPTGPFVVGATPTGPYATAPDPVLVSLLNSNPYVAIVRPEIVPPKPRPVVSTVMESLLIHRVEPVYPSLARSARIQGPVMLTALISKEGLVEGLQVLSGHPLLNKAALDAVRQWRYRPYLLNGQPVEVQAQITVNFVLTQ